MKNIFILCIALLVIPCASHAATAYIQLDSPGNVVLSGPSPLSTDPTAGDAGSIEISNTTAELKAKATGAFEDIGYAEVGISTLDPYVFQNIGMMRQTFVFTLDVDGSYTVEAPASASATAFISAKTSGTSTTTSITHEARAQHIVNTSNGVVPVVTSTENGGSVSVFQNSLSAFSADLKVDVELDPGETYDLVVLLRVQAATTFGVSAADFFNTATLSLLASDENFTINGEVADFDWITIDGGTVIPLPASAWFLITGIGSLLAFRKQRK